MLVSEYVGEYKRKWDDLLKNPTYFSGLPLFHPELDEAVRGLRRGEVTALGGGTATGKSSFALRVVAYNFLYSAVPSSGTVLYVTAEMPNRSVVTRLVSILTGVPGIFLQSGEAVDFVPVWERKGRKVTQVRYDVDRALTDIDWAIGEISNWGLDLQDRSFPTTMQIGTWIKGHHEDGMDVPLVVIDHIGKISDAPPVDNSVALHEYKLSALMALAKDMDTHVLVLHDLDKVGTQKGEPDVTNLKGSSASQYDPDNIILISSEDGRRGEKVVHFNLVKNRHGAGYTGRYGPTSFAQPAGLFGIDLDKMEERYTNLTGEYK